MAKCLSSSVEEKEHIRDNIPGGRRLREESLVVIVGQARWFASTWQQRKRWRADCPVTVTSPESRFQFGTSGGIERSNHCP